MPVSLIDSSQASIDKGLKFAEKLLAKDVGKGRLSQEDADAARGRLTTSTQLEDLSDVDFVIEAVPVRPFSSVTLTMHLRPIGNSGSQVEDLLAACPDLSISCHSRNEHILHLNYQDRCQHKQGPH